MVTVQFLALSLSPTELPGATCCQTLMVVSILQTVLVLGVLGLSVFAKAGAVDSTERQVHLVDQKPVSVRQVEPGIYLVDFGKVAFGNVALRSPSTGKVKVHFGESLANGRIDRKPPGTVRYISTEATFGNSRWAVIAPPPDARNTETQSTSHPPAILTPSEWGVVVPFRWVEIEGWNGEFRAENIKRKAAFATTWNDHSATFTCSDPMFNQIWELCTYSIKATTFAGVFVDGDRERIPYEADAYLNQLSYYATSADIQLPRKTFDHLMTNGTWPTEWSFHMIFMAYADWMHTGDREWLAARYDSLKTKLQTARVGEDGLVHSSQENIKRTDIVDWPAAERDDYEFGSLNAVVNAFYVRSLGLMASMGSALGREAEAKEFKVIEMRARAAFQSTFYDPIRMLYRDHSTSHHSSLHANLFPLAFDLVPDNNRDRLASWLVSKGMKCSVYAAQYLLDGLFSNGSGQSAMDLIVAPGDRSWRHMLQSGTTITWEAWDQKYKPNQDWNHAWGAAPANLLPRYVLGIQPLEAGWKKVQVAPCLGALTYAKGKIPTPQGAISADWKAGRVFRLNLKLPHGTTATIVLPKANSWTLALVNGKAVQTKPVRNGFAIEKEVSGSVRIEFR